MIISPYKYGQWSEDVFLWKHLIKHKLRSKVPKFFIDIGASNGVSNSNSRYFIHLGWKAWLFEPDPTNFKLLLQNTNFKELCRDKEDHFWVWARQMAITGNREGKIRFRSDGGLSTIDPKGGIQVECRKVVDVFRCPSVLRGVGILDVDTEGDEEEIVREFLKITKPCFIIIEHQNDGHKMNVQEELLRADYDRLRREGVNDIWQLKSL